MQVQVKSVMNVRGDGKKHEHTQQWKSGTKTCTNDQSAFDTFFPKELIFWRSQSWMQLDFADHLWHPLTDQTVHW